MCLDCGALHQRGATSHGPQYPRFSDLWQPLKQALDQHTNRRLVQPGERPHFSWGQGLAGQRTPDTVVELAVEPLPLRALLDVLRGGEGAVSVLDEEFVAVWEATWKPRRLRSCDGSLSFTLEDRALVDEQGVVRYLWDGLYLRGPDGTPLTESKTVCTSISRAKPLVIRSLAPLTLEPEPEVSSSVSHYDGGIIATRNLHGITGPDGRELFSWPAPIPEAFVHVLALQMAREVSHG